MIDPIQHQSEECLIPRPLKPWMIVVGILPFLISLVEIQFSVPSWNFWYHLLRGPLLILRSILSSANEFVSELAIGVIIIAVWIYRPKVRHTIAPYLMALLIASTIVSVTKVVTGRARPHHGAQMDESEQREVAAYLATHANPVLKAQRGDYWLWLSKDRPGLDFLEWFHGTRPWFVRDKALSTGDYSSFPSGHVTSALLLALYLTMLFPRARFLWYLVALCTCLYRIFDQMHYPGDVLAGGSLGWLTGCYVFSRPWAARFGYWAQRKVEMIPGLSKSA